MKATYIKPVVEILDFCTEEIAVGGGVEIASMPDGWDEEDA